MSASQALWDKFRKAQKIKAGDAAFAYQHAIDLENKGKMKDAEWWEKMGDDAMPTEEHATR
jgi:hypothetical protein